MPTPKPKAGKKIFISHASNDKVIAQDFIDLILIGALGVGIEEIFASTIEGAKIESGDDWRDSIKENLHTAKITFIIITPNYKESEVSLNEMGAAWVLSGKTLPVIVEPINYKSVGVIQQPKQIEKLLDEGSLDRIKDIVQRELEIPVEKIKSDRWTQKKKEFIAKLKKHVEANPFPIAIERSEFDSLNAQVKDMNSTIDNMIIEKMELEQLVGELKAAKDKDAVKAILKKREPTNEIDEFKELIKQAKEELNKFGYVVQKIFFKEFSRNDGITIDVEDNGRVLDEAIARKVINEELELNHDNLKVKKVFASLTALKKFIEGDKSTEAVYNYIEENYKCELDITNLDFWEEVFEIQIYF
jgi:hypothetical protein